GPVAGSVCPSRPGAPNIRPRAPPPAASTIKCIDIAAEMQIRSAIALDHLKNYIYSEADKEKPMSEGSFSRFLKAAADGDSEGGNNTFSSQDVSHLFSVERLASLGIMMQ
nr:putative transcription elongation factor SPT5 homolog 1 isoform X1 [Tanacetum cinerariifolium]